MSTTDQNTVQSNKDLEVPRNVSPPNVRVPDSDRAYLNAILRMADAPSNFQTITNPVQATPHQRDHFLEVQHIVDIVLNRYGTEWYNLKMGLFIDLATFVSDHRNLFAINATLNQAKKTIPFVDYRVDPTIQRYLAFQTGERWRTVEGSVKELVNDMVNRQGAFPDLTRFVGNSVKTMFRW